MVIDGDNKVDSSVFAGITRNSISFDDIKAIFNGQIIEKTINNRFLKSSKVIVESLADVEGVELPELVGDVLAENNVSLPASSGLGPLVFSTL